MSKYYKAEDVEKLMVFSGICDGKTCGEIAKALQSLPIIDIVHCGECEYWSDDFHNCIFHDLCDLDYKSYDFCSYGERIGNEQIYRCR